MIGLIDPALLLPRTGDNPSRIFCDEVDPIVKVCHEQHIRLLPIEGYWDGLWFRLGRALERQLDPIGRRTLQALRNLGAQHNAVHNAVDAVAWRRGFQQLFGPDSFLDDWELPMASAVAVAISTAARSAVSIDAEASVVVFVRRIEGRNLITHRAENSTLDENSRWALYVQLQQIGPRQILCVYNPRNVKLKWTCRFDWRLPSEEDRGQHPFVPPERWWKGSTEAFRTVNSKHAWIDRNGNAWARPNIPAGAGYHWDVYRRSSPRDTNHINVVAFGVPTSEGRPGDEHH